MDIDERSSGFRTHALPVALLFVLALLAYFNSLHTGFNFDAEFLIVGNRWLRAVDADNLTRILTEDYWLPRTLSGLYRPFTTLTYLFNYSVLGNGINAVPYHWTNLLLHWLNMVLVYLLGLRLFRERWAALAAAGIFGLHPVATEAVTNIAGRTDLLACAAVLGGLLCHIQGAASAGTRRFGWLAALALVALVGQFSKESAVVLPAIMAAYDFIFHKAAEWRSRLDGYLAVAPPLAAYWIIRAPILAKHPLPAFPFVDNPLIGADFFTARFTAVKVLGHYLWLLLYPSRLSCDYSYNQIPLLTWRFDSWSDWQAVVALAFCGLAIAAAVASYRRLPALCFLIGFFFITILPTSNLVTRIGSIMAVRFLYLPSVAFAGCMVMLLCALGRRLGSMRVAWTTLAALVIALGVRTYVRNFDWKSDDTLWESALRNVPGSFKPHQVMSAVWHTNFPPPGGVKRAIAEVELSLAILDGLPDAENTVTPYRFAGEDYQEMGDLTGSPWWYEKSAKTLERAAAIDRAHNQNLPPTKDPRGSFMYDVQLYHDLGMTYLKLHQPQKAVEILEYGRSLPPYHPGFDEDLVEARKALQDAQK